MKLKIILVTLLLLLVLRAFELSFPKSGYSSILTVMGEDLERQKKIPQAIQAFKAAIKHNPAYPPALFSLAELYDAQGDWSKAEPLYHRLINLGPNYQNIYQELQQSDVKKDSLFALSCYKIGIQYFNNENYPLALEYLKRSVIFNGISVDARYALAMAYLKTNDIPGAIEQSMALQNMQIYPPAKKIREQIPNFEKYEYLLH